MTWHEKIPQIKLLHVNLEMLHKFNILKQKRDKIENWSFVHSQDWNIRSLFHLFSHFSFDDVFFISFLTLIVKFFLQLIAFWERRVNAMLSVKRMNMWSSLSMMKLGVVFFLFRDDGDSNLDCCDDSLVWWPLLHCAQFTFQLRVISSYSTKLSFIRKPKFHAFIDNPHSIDSPLRTTTKGATSLMAP